MRRHSFTLIEMTLSLSLLALLLSTLFFWYNHLTRQKNEISQKRWPLIEERYAQMQLQRILPKAADGKSFFTEDRSLVFTYDNGVHAEPLLSNTVVGKLYLDESAHCLTLGVWPVEKGQPSLSLPLLDNVEQLSFDFYYPPNPHKLAVDPGVVVGHIHPQTGWQNGWYAAYEELPPLMTLTVLREGREIKWGFELTNSEKPIIPVRHL